MDEEDVAWLKLMNEKRKSKFFPLVGGEKHKEKNVKKQNVRKGKLYMYALLGLSGMTGMFTAPVHWWNLASCIYRQRKANTKRQELISRIFSVSAAPIHW